MLNFDFLDKGLGTVSPVYLRVFYKNVPYVILY